MVKSITINLNLDMGLLKDQIYEVLESNMPDSEKQGVHNLLGYLLDKAKER